MSIQFAHEIPSIQAIEYKAGKTKHSYTMQWIVIPDYSDSEKDPFLVQVREFSDSSIYFDDLGIFAINRDQFLEEFVNHLENENFRSSGESGIPCFLGSDDEWYSY